MDVIDNPQIRATDVSLSELVAALSERADLQPVFYYEGRPVKPGYHVTEVKAGQFSALDCGVRPEAWNEIFVQVWDVDEHDRTHMTANAFMASSARCLSTSGSTARLG